MTTIESGAAGLHRRRIFLIDLLRVVALFAMASYHFMWDLTFFGYLDPAFPVEGWPKVYARCIASTFILLAGLSFVMAHGETIRWRSYWKRFAKIAAAALLVTVGTYFAVRQGFVFFGILHSIAAMSLIALPLRRAHPAVLLLLAPAAIVAPHFLTSSTFDHPALWWLGLSRNYRLSFDYVPILPWIAAFLAGMALAKLPFFMRFLKRVDIADATNSRWKITISFLSRHSLVFYLVHQPVLMGALYCVALVYPAPKPDPETVYMRDCRPSCETNQSAAFCARFCQCTLDGLKKENLLQPLQSGAISVDNNTVIKDIALECSIPAQ